EPRPAASALLPELACRLLIQLPKDARVASHTQAHILHCLVLPAPSEASVSPVVPTPSSAHGAASILASACPRLLSLFFWPELRSTLGVLAGSLNIRPALPERYGSELCIHSSHQSRFPDILLACERPVVSPPLVPPSKWP